MAITQLSVFLDNKPGKLAEVLCLLKDKGINMRALSLAETADYGILRMIVSDLPAAESVLQEKSAVTRTSVTAVRVDDRAGAMYDVVSVLGSAGINIEYVYAFTSPVSGNAYVVLRTDDAERCEAALRENGIGTLSDEEMEL